MIDALLKEITDKFLAESGKLQSFATIPEAQIRTILESALRKCNLVSKDEFEAQSAVLQRSREKIDALELAFKELEDKLNTQT